MSDEIKARGRLRCVELVGDRECLGPSVAVERDGQPRCLTHARDELRIRRREERNLAGGRGRLRVPANPPTPTFDTRRHVVRFLERLAAQVLAGEVDPRLSAEARGCASVAMQAHELDALERLDRMEAKILGRRRSA